jgi:hypothetical protein
MMTKTRFGLAVLLLLVMASSAFAANRKALEVATLGASCNTVRLEESYCDVDIHGVLESGDCTFSDGTRYDRYTFTGRAGDVVEIMVRPLSATYTKPYISLLSPLGDPADPPTIYGGNGGASIWYKLSSSGIWIVTVSTEDLFAAGPYVLHIYCYEPEPETPQSCIFQYLLCGQTAEWQLNADSCKFTNDNSVYAGWWIYAVEGDRLQFEQTSFSFEPLFGLYREGELLRSSSRDSSFRAEMSYVVRETGWHYFLTTSVEDARGGSIDVKLDCQGSGCTWPYLVSEPPSATTVTRGTSATLPFTVNAVGGYTVRLMDPNPLEGTVFTTVSALATSITTPPVTRPATYVLDVENACGTWVSNPFTVAPEVSRRRSVRK